MRQRRRHSGLLEFIRKTCPNYDGHYGYCRCFDDSVLVNGKLQPVQEHERCLIQRGERCGLFEKVLLGIARQDGIYDRISGQYVQVNRAIRRVTVRRCPDCGAELLPRRRYCDSCKERRRRKTNRENVRRHRKKTG